ncbi:MAG TPA: ABC transporter permease subunit [Candidatus Dormibacteraeota bacterium]|nr:ABC transporter permease subunit [Candidatus Dormibacteraeota bacterium]
MLAALLAHLLLCVIAVAVAAAIALPLGFIAARQPSIERALSGAFGALYTIPSLALLAILVRYLGLGNLSVEIALIAYALYAIFRATVAGVRAIPSEQREVALALGIGALRRNWRIELPLALPNIVAGIRIAMLGSIALATLGGYVGGSGLGTIIFTGFALQNRAMLIEGAVAVAALAVLTDIMLRSSERLLRERLAS